MPLTPQRLKQYLLAGVSHMVPFVACGGILIAIAVAFAPMKPGSGPDFSHSPLLHLVHTLGTTAMGLVVPVLAGYIAHGMADRPGLAPGFIGGAVAQLVGAGFLGGLAAGLLAGFTVMGIRKLPVPRTLRPVMPILIIPLVSSLLVGGVMYEALGHPIRWLMESLNGGLRQMGSGNQIFLGVLLGAMIAFDMGGPVNKAAFFFGMAMIQEGHPQIMGACAAAICIPPLGLGLATRLAPSQWSDSERDSGLAALAMGVMGITEGALPFAAVNPLQIIPIIMAGSALGGGLAMAMGVGDQAPHGGLIVLPVITARWGFLAAITAGTLTVALLTHFLRRAQRAAESTEGLS